MDSPAVARKDEVPSERRVPSCPQKEGSKVHRRHTAPVAVSDDGSLEDIKPRTLDMNDADPVNGLSLSPMNMSSPQPSEPSPPRVGNARGAHLIAAEHIDPRRKRARLGEDDEQAPFAARFGGAEAAPGIIPVLQHHNSIADTKMLFTRQARAASKSQQ